MPENDNDDRLAGGPGTDDDLGNKTELRLPLGEERLVLTKHEVERVAARVGLRIHTEEVAVSEQLQAERVEIRRVPVDRIVGEVPETRVEGNTTTIPVVEEVLVVQYRVVEEIQIVRHAETVEHAETVSLRKQEAVIVDAETDEVPNNPLSREGPP